MLFPAELVQRSKLVEEQQEREDTVEEESSLVWYDQEKTLNYEGQEPCYVKHPLYFVKVLVPKAVDVLFYNSVEGKLSIDILVQEGLEELSQSLGAKFVELQWRADHLDELRLLGMVLSFFILTIFFLAFFLGELHQTFFSQLLFGDNFVI